MTMETLEHHEAILEKLNDQYFDDLAKLEERFKNGELEEAVKYAIDALLKNTDDMRERAFKEYKVAASKGFPLKERENLVNWKKVRWCDQEIKRLTELKKKHNTRPFREWLAPEDYHWIRKAGLREFVRMNLNHVLGL